jgi:hypothetical protein
MAQPCAAAVTWRSLSSISTTRSGNETLTEPASCASGDVVIGAMVYDSTSTTAANATQPSGWTVLYSGTQGAFKYNVSWVQRGGSAPSYVWTIAGTSIYREVNANCLTGSAAITLDSQSASGTAGNKANPVNPDPPATTAVATTSLAVTGGVAWQGATTTWTVSTGYTRHSDTTSGNDLAVGVKSLSASGSENPGAFSGGANPGGTADYWDGFTVTYTDAGGGGGTACQQRLTTLGVSICGEH